MNKFIFLLITSILFAMSSKAQKINATVSGTNVTCMGGDNGNARVRASGAFPPFTYKWEPSGQTKDTATGLSAAVQYTVTVYDALDDSTEAYIILSTIDTMTVGTSSTEPSCFGMNNGTAAITSITGGTAPFQILWTPGGQTTDTATNLPASTYTAQVIDNNGCVANQAVPLQQPPQLMLTANSIASLATAYASGGTAPYIYSWSPGGETGSVVTGMPPGTYTVTVNDANLCSNQSIVTVDTTTITFSFTYPETSCGDPSYVDFSVWAASNPPSVFNSCVLEIQYSKNEFAGDNFANKGIIVTQGADFQPGIGNDYNILDTFSLPGDTIMLIKFGSPLDSSVNGTLLAPLSKALLNVRLRVQNSCSTGTIRYPAAFLNDSNFYSLTYKTINHIDSTSVVIGDSICCPYSCTYPCDPYPCNWWCCRYDLDSNCIDSCYDICYHTCTGTCYDTFNIYGYTYDTVYNYYSHNFQYFTSGYLGSRPTTGCDTMKMLSWTPYINAGTNALSVSPDPAKIPPNSSIFTIKGQGFGTQKGQVFVTDANSSPSIIILDSMDILSWTENLIKIKMPSYMLEDTNISSTGIPHTPGSGYFAVDNACHEAATGNLQINYNIRNDYHIPTKEKTRPNIIMYDTSASFIWRCDTSVSNNPRALACVRYAIYLWNCYTGVHWKLGPSDTMAKTMYYGASNIYFSDINFAPSTALMYTQQQFLYPCYDTLDSISFYNQAYTMVKRDRYLGQHWSYDTTGIGYSNDSVYFLDEILHELGHAMGLNHINDQYSLMYRTTTTGFRPTIISQGAYYPGPATLLGGLDIVSTSAAYIPGILNSDCRSDSILRPSKRGCIDPTLNVPIVPGNPFNLNLYPNPINSGYITISYQLNEKSYIQFKILDCTGRVIMELNIENRPPGTYKEEINIDALAGGVYLFTANINGQNQTIKFIKI